MSKLMIIKKHSNAKFTKLSVGVDFQLFDDFKSKSLTDIGVKHTYLLIFLMTKYVNGDLIIKFEQEKEQT